MTAPLSALQLQTSALLPLSLSFLFLNQSPSSGSRSPRQPRLNATAQFVQSSPVRRTVPGRF